MALFESENEETYKPSIDEASSVILISVCCLSILASAYVSLSVYKIGAHTASSKLILYLTLTHANMNFAKVPFLFNQFPYGCDLSGILFFYSYAQIYIIAYYMISCTYDLLLEGNGHTEISPLGSRRVITLSDYQLNNSAKGVIFLVPLLALVFPLSSNVFVEKFNWCGINPDSRFGFLVFVQYMIIFAVTSLLIFRILFQICSELHSTCTHSSSEVFYRFYKGPFMYAFVSFAIILGCSVFIFTRVNGDDMDRREYYHQYMIIAGMYIPGLFYFIIFHVEKKYIKSIEEDYDEVHLFSQEFCDQDSPSDSRSSSCRLSSSSSFKTSSSLCLGGEEGAREAGLRSSLLLDEEERY